MNINSVRNNKIQSQSFAGKSPKTTSSIRSFLAKFKSTQKDTVTISSQKLKAAVPIAPLINIETKDGNGITTYLRIFDQAHLEGLKIEGKADIGGGIFKDGKVQQLNAYGNAKIINTSSPDGTFVGENASLSGGEHEHFNIQGNGKVSKATANNAVLYYNGKISDSTIHGEVEANDFSTVENIKAAKINMVGWFSKLKGNKNECKQLQADLVWRILNLDFRKEIKTKNK